MIHKDLTSCEVGEVKTLTTCEWCHKIVRVKIIKGGVILTNAHWYKRERCIGSKMPQFLNVQYTLQQVRSRGKVRLKWIPVLSFSPNTLPMVECGINQLEKETLQ